MSNEKRSILPGLILVVIGCIILFNKFDLFDFRFRDIFPYLLLFLGFWFLYRLIGQGHRSAAFPATLFVLFGAFLIISRHSYYFWRFYDFGDFWPIVLVIIGLAFLVQFLVKPKDWGLLIPSFILLFIGSLFFANNMGWLYIYDLEYYIQLYWPVILIFIGASLVLANLRKKVSSG